MMAGKNLNIGMVGYGFMGRAHSNAWRRVSNFFDSGYQPVLKAVAARDKTKAQNFADMWGYEFVETDWRKLVERKDIDAIDICVPNDLHAEIAIAAAKAGKMVLCEKPLARDAKEALPMVRAVEKAGVANTVWYNYRRIPAVTLIKQIVDAGKARKDLSLPRQFSAGLDDQSRRAAGRRRDLAARREGSGLRRHRRPSGPLHRHGDLDQRRDFPRLRDDRDVREATQERALRQGGEGRHRRRGGGARALRQRLARHVRIDALRARPQGALHAGDQRRARLLHVGPARHEPSEVVRPFGGGAAARLDRHPRHRRRAPLSRQSGGCRASSSATSTPSCTRRRISSKG